MSSPGNTVARALLGLASLCASAAWAQQASTATGIYTCTDERGRRLTSDRPIAECLNRDQRVLNRDGSVRTVVAPPMTAEERSEAELRERRAAELRAAQSDALRRDRNLVTRYPDEAAHGKAREAALDSVRAAQKFTEKRLAELAKERVPLTNEAEFYKGKRLPPKLKAQLDANDAAVEAQKDSVAAQAAELERINKLYDDELARLKKLWGGAQPGSLGPAPADPGKVGKAAAATPAKPGAPASPSKAQAASKG